MESNTTNTSSTSLEKTENLPEQLNTFKQQCKLREIQEVKNKINPSLFLAYQRVIGLNKADENSLKDYLDMVSTDIYESFPNATVNQIKGALKHGSTGKYGMFYKFTGLIVCTWIEQYLKDNPRKKSPDELEWEGVMKHLAPLMEGRRGHTKEEAINHHFATTVSGLNHEELFGNSVGVIEINGKKVDKNAVRKHFQPKFEEAKSRFLELDRMYNSIDED